MIVWQRFRTNLERLLLEPMSALTHFIGAIAAVLSLFLLAFLTHQRPAKMISLVIYGISMIVLYSTSTLFHGIKLPEERRMFLNRLDHVAIFLLIAGTYTPIVFNLFPDPWRWPSLTAIWLVAIGGMIYKLFSPKIHGLINASIYPAMSWAGVVLALLIFRIGPFVEPLGVALLLTGGLIYMIGFVIYYRRKPDPWPDFFGHHELWHLFVMGGSFFHFLFMLLYVVPEG